LYNFEYNIEYNFESPQRLLRSTYIAVIFETAQLPCHFHKT